MEFRHYTSGILLVTSSIETKRDVLIDFPPDPVGNHVSAQFFLQGSATIILGNGAQADWRPDCAAVIRADTPGFTLRIAAGQKLRHVCVGMYQHVITQKMRDQFSDALKRLLLDKGPVDVAEPITSNAMRRDIAYDLYRRHRNDGLDQIRSESLSMQFLGDALETYDADLQSRDDTDGPGASDEVQGCVIRAFKAMIDAAPNQRITEALCRERFGLSQARLHKMFRAQMNVSVVEYRRALLMLGARQALLEGQQSIKAIGYDAGYAHVGNFTRAYIKEFGETPSDTRQRSVRR